jgi:hypothetical protein
MKNELHSYELIMRRLYGTLLTCIGSCGIQFCNEIRRCPVECKTKKTTPRVRTQKIKNTRKRKGDKNYNIK